MAKLYIILLLVILTLKLNAQTYFGPNYLHLCSANNCTGDYTNLDPTIIGNNQADKLLFTHVWGDRSGGHSTWMTQSHGLEWQGTNWSIFNETQANIDTNLAFNVLNANTNGYAFTHTVTSSNLSGNNSYYTIIEDPVLNNHPDVVFFISKTRENGIYETAHVGIWYDPYIGKWTIFNEAGDHFGDSLKINSTYTIFVPGQGTTYFQQVASSSFYITYIDNPMLNGNPDAMIFVVHDNKKPRAIDGAINDEIGVEYDGVVWSIINEMDGPFYYGATFNVLVAQPLVAGMSGRQDAKQTLKVFPNPASDHLNVLINRSFSSEPYSLTLSSVEGRILLQRSLTGDLNGQLTLDVGNLETGMYVMSVMTSQGFLTSKINIVK